MLCVNIDDCGLQYMKTYDPDYLKITTLYKNNNKSFTVYLKVCTLHLAPFAWIAESTLSSTDFMSLLLCWGVKEFQLIEQGVYIVVNLLPCNCRVKHLLPGKKGMILFLGSFCPASIGNLSRIRICKSKMTSMVTEMFHILIKKHLNCFWC